MHKSLLVAAYLKASSLTRIYINHPEPPERTGGTDDSDGEHLLTQAFFRKLSQTLKPDGRIVIVTDNKNYGESLRKISERSGFCRFLTPTNTNDEHNR